MKEKVYYTSHTCLCVPLEGLLQEIKDYLEVFRSEIVVLSVRADFFPLNLDLLTGNTDIVHALDIKDKMHTVNLYNHVSTFLGEMLIDDIMIDTRVKDLQFSNKRVLLFIEYQLQKVPKEVYLYSSWEYTKDTES